MISHRDRLENCISNNIIDRPPVSLWRHFPVDDQTPEGLAKATINFQNSFDFDFIKVTPASSFCLRDWGTEDVWEGASEGTREYRSRVIQHPDDWRNLPLLDPDKGYLGKQLECLRLITKEVDPHTPVIQTIFNPLSQAKNLIGNDQLLVHMRKFPDALQAGLDIITENTRSFVDAVLETGVSGIFYAVQHAQLGLLTPHEYDTFGALYDKRILEMTQDLWLNILHLHGSDIMFDKFINYPIQVINWHDKETEPDLKNGQSRFSGIVCGGLRREETIVLGTPDKVTVEARDSIKATEGKRFILGTGCVTPINAPFGNILAARTSVENI